MKPEVPWPGVLDDMKRGNILQYLSLLVHSPLLVESDLAGRRPAFLCRGFPSQKALAVIATQEQPTHFPHLPGALALLSSDGY